MTYQSECDYTASAFSAFLDTLRANGHDFADLSHEDCARLIAGALSGRRDEGPQALCTSFDMAVMGYRKAVAA